MDAAAIAAVATDDGCTEAFPMLTPASTNKLDRTESKAAGNNDLLHPPPSRARRRSRGSSLKDAFLNSNPPLGMWQATAEVGSKIPTLSEIKNGAFSDEGWSHEGQMEHRGSDPHQIHRQRLARTSTSSTRATKSSIITTTTAIPATPRVGEGEELSFFPSRGTITREASAIDKTATRGGPDESSNLEEAILASPEPHSVVRTSAAPATQPLISTHASDDINGNLNGGPDDTGTYPNGYRFPKKHTWTQSTMVGLKSFWKFFLTPFGFLVTIYGLNVVGWGAMIFFVLLEAAPAMCHPSCNAINSPRKIWIEIDSQVLNGLFCVTAFGLAPWRFRDAYYLFQWRVMHQHDAHRRLAGLYRGWYRLPGSDRLPDDVGPPPVTHKNQVNPTPPPYTEEEMQHLEANPAIPLPVTSMPEPPLTGIRASPSRSWTLDFVIYMYLANTFLQVVLCGFMWGLNRYNRPSWGTGLFISLGCLTGIFAGVMVFIEGSRVKKIEGIPVQEYDVVETVDDYRERKAKEDAKQEQKTRRHERRQERRILRSEKVKGHEWFTRH